MLKNVVQYFRYTRVKIMLTALAMGLAGILYSCSRLGGEEIFSGGQETEAVLLLQEQGQAQESETGAGETDFDGEEEQMPGAGAAIAACFVHICGAVADPGVYEMPEGSRIYQAVEMAGGFLPEADEGYLNLAAVVSDGMKITVLTKEEAKTASPDDGDGGGENMGRQKVNINTAGKEELMTLKGVGESRAEDIIAYRKEHGLFQKIEDIMQVPGIKDGAFQKIKEDITI